MQNTKAQEEFIEQAEARHGKLYDYSQVTYVNCFTDIKIICRKIGHGLFTQKAYVHLFGSGCQICRLSHLEALCRNILTKLDILFEMNKRFDKCRDSLSLPFDIYIPSLKILIELDGIQHFESRCFSGYETDLELQKLHDQIKNDFCRDRDFHLLRISFSEIQNMDTIIAAFIKDVELSKTRIERFVGKEYEKSI